MKKRVFVVAAGLLFCVTLAPASADDPVEEYRRACEAPHFAALSVKTHPGDRMPTDWEGPAAASCRAFIQRLEADPEAGDESRLALLMALDWLGESPSTEVRCAEIGRIASRLPNDPDALYEWSWCVHDDDAYNALLKRIVEMGHPGARRSLVYMFKHTGDYHGFPPETLSLIATREYEDAGYVTPRYRAAQAIYRIALDTGDMQAAKAIQARLVHDHGLDALDYDDPSHRDESLERACDRRLFDMDLEGQLCVPALEALAAEALAHGEAIPDGVLRRMGEAFGESDHKAWLAGGGNDTGAALAAILAAHPEPLRSSEHLRVLAETAAPGSPERLAGLRKAVEADPGNLRARCGLADVLARAGSVGEAASLYKGLMAADGAPCNAEFGLGRLPGGPDGERGGEVFYVD